MTIQKLLGVIFILACMNPWTSFGTNSMDSQPWPLLSAVPFLLSLGRVKLPPYSGQLAAVIFIGLTISLFLSYDPDAAYVVRAIASYASLILVYVASYNYLDRYGFPSRVIVFAAASWIGFAFVEMLAPSIKEMLSAHRTSEGRGLTSLAPEPTYFAIFMVFIAWIILAGTNYRPQRTQIAIILASILSVFLLAKSAMVILYLAVAAAIYCSFVFLKSACALKLRARHIPAMLAVVILVPAGIGLINTSLADSRAAHLLEVVSRNGISGVINTDASISRRAEDAALSIHSAINNFLIPGGIDTFETVKEDVRHYWSGMFWYPSTGNKIMSWNGVIIYELGVFGVAAIIFLVMAALRRGGATTAEVVTLLAFAVGAIPMAFPLIPLLFAVWAHNAVRWTGNTSAQGLTVR